METVIAILALFYVFIVSPVDCALREKAISDQSSDTKQEAMKEPKREPTLSNFAEPSPPVRGLWDHE